VHYSCQFYGIVAYAMEDIALVVAWRSSIIVWHMNKVTLRRARLVLGWVTIFGG